MSISKINKLQDSFESIQIQTVFNKFSSAATDTSTYEEVIKVESQILKYLDSLRSIEFKKLTEFSKLDVKDSKTTESLIADGMDTIMVESEIVKARLIQRVNEISAVLQSTFGKIKRLKQMSSALDLWDGNFIKFALCENFDNYDWVSFEGINQNKMTIDTVQSVCLLPIIEKKEIPVSSLSILKGNGQAGNSNKNVDIESQFLKNIIDKNVDTWFEYEKLKFGPVELELRVVLEGEHILNCIELEPYLFAGSVFEIVDVYYTGSFGGYKSLKDLMPAENQESLLIKNLATTQFLKINFLPVKTNSIVFKFKSSDFTYIEVAGSKNTTQEKRYAIGIKEIRLFSNRFSSEGSLTCENRLIEDNCYVGSVEVKAFPEAESLYTSVFNITTDGGKSWEQINNLGSFLVEDDKILKYKFSILRNNKMFENISSFFTVEELVDVKAKEKVFSKKINPTSISIDEKIYSEDLFVYQLTSIALSSEKFVFFNKNKRLNFRELLSSDSPYVTFEFKEDYSRYNIRPEDIEIEIDNIIFEEVVDLSLLVDSEDFYYLKDDLSGIIVHKKRVDYNSKLKVRIKPEEILFEKRTSGYYAKFNNLFRPSKGSISLKYFSGKKNRKTISLDRSERFVNLNHFGIDKDTLRLNSLEDEVFVFGSEKKFVGVNEQNPTKEFTLFFNERRSLIYMPEMNSKSTVKLEYEYEEVREIPVDGYRIWMESGVPKGIIINESSFSCKENEEVLSLTNTFKERFSLKDKKYKRRSDKFSGNKKIFTLRDKNIVSGTVVLSSEVFGLVGQEIKPVEKQFIDGETEFLNLKVMEKEFTISIYSGDSETVQFKLGAGSLFYKKGGIIFQSTQFSAEKETLSEVLNYGDYYINNEGVVTVFIGRDEFLEEGQIIAYYYSAPEQEDSEYMFSIDYRKGLLYLSEEATLSQSSKISYKSCEYIAEYEVVDQLNIYTYNSEMKKVEIDTSHLDDKSDRIGVGYSVRVGESDIKDHYEYFSPIVSKLNFRFK